MLLQQDRYFPGLLTTALAKHRQPGTDQPLTRRVGIETIIALQCLQQKVYLRDRRRALAHDQLIVVRFLRHSKQYGAKRLVCGTSHYGLGPGC